MKRRTFLQIAAAALAAPFRGAAEIRLEPGPPKIKYHGCTFVEDPDPLRLILTPEYEYELVTNRGSGPLIELPGILDLDDDTKLILGSEAHQKMSSNPAWRPAPYHEKRITWIDPGAEEPRENPEWHTAEYEIDPYTGHIHPREVTQGDIERADALRRRDGVREDQRGMDATPSGPDPALATRQEPPRDQAHPPREGVEARVGEGIRRCPACGGLVSVKFDHLDHDGNFLCL